MIRPLGDRIAIRPIGLEELPSGLWSPPEQSTFTKLRAGTASNAQTRGVVLSIGRGCKGNGYENGSIVQFSDSCGRPFDYDGEHLFFIREDDIAFVES